MRWPTYPTPHQWRISMNIIKSNMSIFITTPSTPRYQSLRARLDGLKQRSETGLPQKNCVAALLEPCFHPRNDRNFASRFVKTVTSDEQIGIFPQVSFRQLQRRWTDLQLCGGAGESINFTADRYWEFLKRKHKVCWVCCPVEQLWCRGLWHQSYAGGREEGSNAGLDEVMRHGDIAIHFAAGSKQWIRVHFHSLEIVKFMNCQKAYQKKLRWEIGDWKDIIFRAFLQRLMMISCRPSSITPVACRQGSMEQLHYFFTFPFDSAKLEDALRTINQHWEWLQMLRK